MKEKPLISVIVPAYNVAQWFGECVESILAQTYKNIEVILVDDGSKKDNTPQICDEYAAKDGRVKVVHQENSGANTARKHGVAVSSGLWLTFVDADDTIADNMVEDLVSYCFDDVDLVASCDDANLTLTSELYGNRLLCWNGVQLWGKLFRRTLLDDLWALETPSDITVAEDFLTNLRSLRKMTGKAVVIKNKLYHYRQVDGSLIHSFRATPEYDIKVMKEALDAIAAIHLNLRQGSVVYQIGILQHLICWGYPISKVWLKHLRNEASECELNSYQRLTLKAGDNGCCAAFVRLAEPAIRVVKKVKRTIKWG